MPRIFEVDELLLAAQQQSDKENDDHITESEWKRMLHSVWGEHYSEIVNSGMRYYENTVSIAGSDLTDDGFGGGSFPLPEDCMVHVGVDRAEGERWEHLDELMVQERNWLTGSSNNKTIAYAVIGQKLHLYPKPPAGSNHRFIYVPQPIRLRNAAGTQKVDVITPDGEMFIVWALTVMALAKEEADVTVAVAERARFLERLKEWAAERSFHTPRRRQVIRDPSFNQMGDVYNDPGNYRR